MGGLCIILVVAFGVLDKKVYIQLLQVTWLGSAFGGGGGGVNIGATCSCCPWLDSSVIIDTSSV